MPSDLSGYPPEIAALLEEYNREVGALMGRLEAGKLSAAAWKKEFQKLLATFSQAAYLLGYGDGDAAIPVSVETWLKDQFGYLDGFANVIQSAGEYDPAWLPRAQMYGASAVTEYWEGKVGDLPLPAMPGQGTQCLSNCKCSWRIEWIDRKAGDADAYWEMSDAEHCQTCVVRNRDWYPVEIRGGQLQ